MPSAAPARLHLVFACAFALAGLGGCSCETQLPALRVSVQYLGFQPGCVQVIASDPSGGTARTATPQVPPGSRDGVLTVAVYREAAWGPTVRITAQARELDCSGPIVASDFIDASPPEGQTQLVGLTLAATDMDEDRYVVSPPGRDCADNDPARYPGALERCDGVDQDCDQVPDNGLGVGTACSSDGGCSGVIACLADGGTGCTATGGTLYPDEDGDGTGSRSGAGMCAAADAGFVPNQDDCDDGDPFSFLGAREICDRRDNDCDGRADRTPDGGTPCPSSPAWVDYSPGGGNHDWHAVWSWTDGGVWVASVTDSHINRRLPTGTGVTFINEDCSASSGVWQGIWADPRNAEAYVVGDGAKMLVNRGGTAGCIDRSSIADTPGEPRAVWGFVTDAGAVELYVVGDDGDTARWDGGAGVTALDSVPALLRDVHGASREHLFAVGVGTNPAGRPQIFRFREPRGWSAEALPAEVAASTDAVVGVHVASPRLAYGVTAGSRVLRWDGQQWEAHPSPDAGQLTKVLAFGKSSVFALGSRVLWEWDGGSWGPVLDVGVSNPALYDLHGTNPADIWVVGDDGTVRRWPQ